MLLGIIERPDDMSDFMDRYWSEGHVPIAKQVKLAFQDAFRRFAVDELRRYDNANPRVKVRDVMFMVRPRPRDRQQADDWREWLKHEP
jgi:hypothetical protein